MASVRLLALRLFNGISNGLVFVLAPALVLEWLAQHQRAHLSGLVYLGFAAGLLLTGWRTPRPACCTAPSAGGQWRWWRCR